ncbi:MAG: PHP domain-containing protein [Steroidobacteraceae bacterium]
MSSPVDLHTHSTASDGLLAPTALVHLAAERGVRVLALTDHDTVAGLDEAAEAAAKADILLLAGVELSATWRGQTVHVLGLGIDPCSIQLATLLQGLAEERLRRAEEIARKLDRAGLPGREVLVEVLAATPRPTRTHFARALVRMGLVHSQAAAFERHLGRGRAAAVASHWPGLEEVLQCCLAAGGVASLAHPLRYSLSAGARRALCADFRQLGGLAMEVACGGDSPDRIATAASLAAKQGLAGSVGSDFHDPATPWNQPGRLAKLPATIQPVWLDAAFPAQAAARAAEVLAA